MNRSPRRIGIIGAGLSGALLALNLLRIGKGNLNPLEIYLIEKRSVLGKGVAYSTEEELHLLNVPANKMGAHVHGPNHFYEWLLEKKFNYAPDDFVPRKLYGIYINEIFKEVLESKDHTQKITIVHAEAIGAELTGKEITISLNTNKNIVVDKLVLASGNFPPDDPKFIDRNLLNDSRYFSNPWGAKNFDTIKTHDSVLLIGSGLTMVDMIINLYNKKHKGLITVLSNHGYLPFVHKKLPDYPSFYEELQDKNTVYDLYHIVKKHIKLAEANNSDWLAVIASLRPHTQNIWQSLNIEERKKFLKYFKSLWEVVRHRIAPKAEEIISALSANGQFQIQGAKIKNVKLEVGKIKAEVTLRKSRKDTFLFFDHILNCTGPHSNYERNPHPFIQSLRAEGILNNDPLNIGIHASPIGNMIDKKGNISDDFYIIGPALKGTLWECTAAPEIKDQAYKLAQHLLKN